MKTTQNGLPNSAKVILSLMITVLTVSAFAGNTCTWTGGKGDGKWSSAENWDTAPVSGNGDTVVLVNKGNDPITIDRGTDEMSIYSLRFGAGSTASITLTGSSLTLTSTDGGSAYTTAGGEVSALYDAAANIEMTVACPIDLPSGTHAFTVGQSANLHVSGIISGKGGIHRHATTTGSAATGTLQLSGSNTFEGGVTLRGANTILAHTNALGKVGKSISMFYAATYRFAAAGDWDYTFSYKEGPATFYMDEQVRFLRDFTEFGAGTTATFYLGSSVSRVDFMGDFGKAANAQAGTHKFTIDCPTGAAVYFHGKVTTETLVLGVDKNERKGWDVHFLADGNEWTAPLNAKFSNVHIYHPNFFHAGESPYMDYPRQQNMGCYHLHGNAQTIGHLTTEHLDQSRFIADAGRYFSTDTATTLTMKNAQDASANVAFMGPLTLVYNATGAYTQAITNRTNGMTGDIIVSNGTLRACGTTSFKNANEIRIEDGGTFELDVSTASALANVKTVRIASGGTFRMTATTPNPFAGGNAIRLKDGAHLVLPVDAAPSIEVYVNDVLVADGRYQAQDGTDATAARVDWLTGAGVLTTSLDGAYWRAAADGKWKDSERWTSAPVADGSASVNSDGGDFTVTVDTDTVPLKTLGVARTDSGVTTLDVGAKLETRYGKVTLGKGAKVSVKTGGTWETTSVDEYSTETKFLLKDGATFSVDGGLFHATNFCGILSVGNGSADAGVTNTLRVTAGTMDFRTRASADSGMIVKADGRVEITGGTARFGAVSGRGSDRPFRHEKGGTVVVSDSGRLELSGSAYFSGTTRFSGNARLSAASGPSPYFYINPVGSGDVATFEFTDSAGVDTTGYGTYGGVEGAYLFSQFFLNNNVDGGTARLLLHGDGLYHFNSYFAMATHRGAAELEQTGGFFRTYSSGIRVGASPYSDQTTAPNATAVWRMKGGAAEIRAADGFANHNRVYGFVVGDGTWVTPAYRGLISGRVELSGGVITNMSYDTILGFGLGDGYGEMIQTGGTFIRKDTGSFLLGFGGGEGRYVMTNGTTEITHEMPIWIGGVTTNAINRYLAHCPDVDTAKGLLRIWGGTFTAEKSDVCLGARGTGRIEIGPTGTATVKSLVLSNAVSSVEASSLRFEFDEKGVGKLHVLGKLTVNPGSKFEIDFGKYTGPRSRFDLVTFDEIAGGFDPANVTMTGNSSLVNRARLSVRGVQDKTIRINISSATVIFVR